MPDPGLRSTLLDPTDEIAAAIAEHLPLTDATVKLTVTCDEEQKRAVDQAAIARLLADSGARLHGGIDFRVRRVARQRVEGFHAGLNPFEALRVWSDANDVYDADTCQAIAELLSETLADLSQDAPLGGTFTPVSVEAEHVGRYRHMEHTFQPAAEALVGANGAGKSMILRCVELALYAGRGDLKPWLSPWADEMRIELHFTLDDEDYRVRRTFKQGRSASLDLEHRWVSTTENGHGLTATVAKAQGWESLNRETTEQTQQHLTRLLGMSRQLFRASAFLAQDDAPGFLELKPAERKAFVGELLDGAGIWPAAYKRAHELATEAQRSIEANAAKVEALQHRVNARPTVEVELAGLERREAEARAMVTGAEQALEAAQKAQADNQARAERVARLRAEYEHAAEAHRKAADSLSAAQEATRLLPEKQAHLEALRESAARVPALEAAKQARDEAAAAREAAVQERDRHQERAYALHEEAKALQRQPIGEGVCGECLRPFDSEESRGAAVMTKMLAAQAEQDKANAVITPYVPEFEPADLSNARTNAEQISGVEEQVRRLSEQAGQKKYLAMKELEKADDIYIAEQALAEASESAQDEHELSVEVQRAKDMVFGKGRDLYTVTADLARARERLSQLEDSEQELAALAEETRQANERLTVYRTAERAFGRDGIPTLMAEEMLPQLEEDANEILRRFPTSNGKVFQLRFETQREKADGGLREELHVVVMAPDCDQAYETLSPGQVARVASCFRLGLCRTIARLRGARSMLLVVDELPFLDRQGGKTLAELVRGFVEDGTFTTAVCVAHDASTIEGFDRVVAVEEGADGFSRILGEAA